MELEKIIPGALPSKFDALADLGMGTPINRFAVGTTVGALATWAFRPSAAFYSDGSAKPWSFTAGPGEEGTPLPWWALSTIPGVLFSVFL
jgi:hypothetical protein